MGKKCKSCGDRFDTDQEVAVEGLDDDLTEKIYRKLEEGDTCPDCLFDQAFYEQTMRGADHDDEV
ncbi:MAG: hypothetical protein M3209_09570 [Acidobacteriota bacterium]|nr:hypothetical protein [Acidobacteriota bacterium]